MNRQESQKLEKTGVEILKTHIPKKSTVVVGVSGGADSIFLFHLLNKAKKDLYLKIIVAHINHLLRGKDSDGDEKFVQTLCLKNDITFALKRANIKSLSKKEKRGLEETGRLIRYDFFKTLAKTYKSEFILTAHHADDNLETILFNFVRGSSLKGLCGMEEKEEFCKNLYLIRPLLNFSKKQIEEYLKLNHIKFRIDKTNKDITYKRNFLRHKVIPILKKINPSFSETVAKNSQNLREIQSFLETKSDKFIKESSLDKKSEKFDAKSFRKLSKAIQKEIILKLYRLHIGNTQNLTTKNIEEVLALIESNTGNKKKKLGKVTFYIKNNIIQILQ